MDQHAIDYTRDHYNKHVKHQDSKEVSVFQHAYALLRPPGWPLQAVRHRLYVHAKKVLLYP